MSSRFSATNQSMSLTSRLTSISTLRDECNRARHPRQSWGRGSAYERRYPECPHSFFLDDQVYVCIVQTASTGFEQIAQS